MLCEVEEISSFPSSFIQPIAKSLGGAPAVEKIYLTLFDLFCIVHHHRVWRHLKKYKFDMAYPVA